MNVKRLPLVLQVQISKSRGLLLAIAGPGGARLLRIWGR